MTLLQRSVKEGLRHSWPQHLALPLQIEELPVRKGTLPAHDQQGIFFTFLPGDKKIGSLWCIEESFVLYWANLFFSGAIQKEPEEQGVGLVTVTLWRNLLLRTLAYMQRHPFSLDSTQSLQSIDDDQAQAIIAETRERWQLLWRIGLGNCYGHMRCWISKTAAEQLLLQDKSMPEHSQGQWQQRVSDIPVVLTARQCLPEKSWQDLLVLQVGDILPLQMPTEIHVADHLIGQGRCEYQPDGLVLHLEHTIRDLK